MMTRSALSLLPAALLTLGVSTPLAADGQRQLDAHRHGTGTLNIAIDGETVLMEFEAPGADLVGFEYAPRTEAEHDAVAAARAALATPLTLFVLPDAAGCVLADASVEGEDEAAHDDHDDDHAEHSDFGAAYTLTCADPAALDTISFAYFEAFPNAEEVEVQVISETGATAYEVTRDAPDLALGR